MTGPTRNPRPTDDQPTTGRGVDLEAVVAPFKERILVLESQLESKTAEVEALRKRVAEQKIDIQQLSDNYCAASDSSVEFMQERDAAQAREIELAGALGEVRPYFEGEHHYDHPSCKILRVALANSSQALERARATREYFKRIIQAIDRTSTSGEIRRGHNEVKRLANEAFDKLDASIPADALERARANDDCVKALKAVRPMLGMFNDFTIADVWKAQKQADEALSALAALTPEDGS